MHLHEIKASIINRMHEILAAKITDAEQAIASAKESRNDDTKSSAGDKFETGRAMMQMEIDNNELQLNRALQQQVELSKIDVNNASTKAGTGSLVVTNHENYFISIALGKIEIGPQTYYAISLASPIGTLLLNKKKGDQVTFQGRTLLVELVA